MNIHLTKSQIGLDGVPAAETVLSHVDGERGELIIAGDHVASLAGKSSFESVTARLWSGATGRATDEAHVRANLGAARQRAFARLPDLLPATRGMSVSTVFAQPSRACAPRAGSITRRPSSAHFPSSRARWCSAPRAPIPWRPTRTQPRGRYAEDAAQQEARSARGRRARRLSSSPPAITA